MLFLGPAGLRGMDAPVWLQEWMRHRSVMALDSAAAI